MTTPGAASTAEPAVAGAAVASAGFAVGRLLLSPPDRAVLDRFADPVGRDSWPVRNGATVAALRVLAEPFTADVVREEWHALLGRGSDSIELRESVLTGGDEGAGGAGVTEALVTDLVERYAAIGLSGREHPADHLGVELTYLAHVAARVGRSVTGHDRPAVDRQRAELMGFRRDHVDRFCGAVLLELEARATTAPMRALPGLVAGFLDAVAELAGRPVRLVPREVGPGD